MGRWPLLQNKILYLVSCITIVAFEKQKQVIGANNLTVCQRCIYNVYENWPVQSKMTIFVREAGISGFIVV